GLATVFRLNNVPASPYQLVVHTEPSPTAVAGQPFATQPVVYVEDKWGNLESGDNTTQVTVALQSGAGPLLGTTTITVTGGIAAFGSGVAAPLQDNKAESVTLAFSSAGLTGANANPIVVAAAAPSQLVIHTEPGAVTTAGKPFAPQPVIYVEDRFHNLET